MSSTRPRLETQDCFRIFAFVSAVAGAWLGLASCSPDRIEAPQQREVSGAWRWHNPVPLGNQLNGVSAVSASNIFVVGDVGSAIRFDGSEWVDVSTEFAVSLNDVWGIDRDNVVAVGDQGFFARLNGAEWELSELGTPHSLVRVSGDDTTLYVLGFRPVNETESYFLLRNTEDAGWVVLGEDFATPDGLWATGNTAYVVANNSVVRYRGSEVETIYDSFDVYSIWGIAEDRVYAGCRDGLLVRYNGAIWDSLDTGATAALWAVWADAEDNVYAGGHDVLVHYDGSTWSQIADDTGYLTHLSGVVNSIDVTTLDSSGRLGRYDGDQWRPVSRGPTTELTALWGHSNNDVVAVGRDGIILQFDGYSWSRAQSPTTNHLNAVWGYDDLFIAVGAGGTALIREDGAWQVVETGVTGPLNSVSGWSENEAVLVGEDGVIMRYIDGELTADASGSTTWLTAVIAWSNGEAVAVGNRVALWFDGEAWNPFADDQLSFREIWGTSIDDLFAIASAIPNQLFSFNGTGWDPEPTEVGGLNALWGGANGELYGVGFDGRVVKRSGGRWNIIDTPTRRTLNDVWGDATGNLFVVGRGGTILGYGR